jgi:hypothetical protein
MRSSLTPYDKQFLIKIAKSVDAIKASQKATEHNIQAAHMRLNKLEAQMNQPGGYVSFKDLMPGFTSPSAQTRFFKHALHKLLDEFKVKRLEGTMEFEIND